MRIKANGVNPLVSNHQPLDGVHSMQENGKAFDNVVGDVYGGSKPLPSATGYTDHHQSHTFSPWSPSSANASQYEKRLQSFNDEDDDDDEEDVPPPLPTSRPPTAPFPYFPINVETSDSSSLSGKVQSRSGVNSPCFSVVSCSLDSQDETFSELGTGEKISEGLGTSADATVLHGPSKRNDLENVDEYYSRRINNDKDFSSSGFASKGSAPLPSKPFLLPPFGVPRIHRSSYGRDEKAAENAKPVNGYNRTFSTSRLEIEDGRGVGGAGTGGYTGGKGVSDQSYQPQANKFRPLTLPSQQLLSVYGRQTNFPTRPKSAGNPIDSKKLTTAISSKEFLQSTRNVSPFSTGSGSSLGYQQHHAPSMAPAFERHGWDNRLSLTSDIGRAPKVDDHESRTFSQSTETNEDEDRNKHKRDESDHPDHRNNHGLRERTRNHESAVKDRDLKEGHRISSYLDHPSIDCVPYEYTNGRSDPLERIFQSNEYGNAINSKGHANQGSIDQSDQSDKRKSSSARESSFEQLEKKLRDDARGRIQRLLVSPGSGGQSRPASSNSIPFVSSLPVIAKKPSPSIGALLTKDQRKSVPYEAVMSPRYQLKSPTTELMSSKTLWGDAGAYSKRSTTSVDETGYWGTRSLPRNMDSSKRWSLSTFGDFGESDALDERRVSLSLSSTDSSLTPVSNARHDYYQGRKEDVQYYSKNPEIFQTTRSRPSSASTYSAVKSHSEMRREDSCVKSNDRKGIEPSVEISRRDYVAQASDSNDSFTSAVPVLTPMPSRPASVAIDATYDDRPASKNVYFPRRFSISPVPVGYIVHDHRSDTPVSPIFDDVVRPSSSLLNNSQIRASSSSSRVPYSPPVRNTSTVPLVIPPSIQALPEQRVPAPNGYPASLGRPSHVNPPPLPRNIHSQPPPLALRAASAPPLHFHPFVKIIHDSPPSPPASNAPKKSYPASDLPSDSASYIPRTSAVQSTTRSASSVPRSPRTSTPTNLPVQPSQYPKSSSAFVSARRQLPSNSPKTSAPHSILTRSSPPKTQASADSLASPRSPQSSYAHSTASVPSFQHHPVVPDPNSTVPPSLPAVAPPSFPTAYQGRPSHAAHLSDPPSSVTEVNSRNNGNRHQVRSSNSSSLFPMSRNSTETLMAVEEKRAVKTNDDSSSSDVVTHGRPEDGTSRGSEPDKSFTYFPISHSRAAVSGREGDTEKNSSSFYRSSLSISLRPFVDLENDDSGSDDHVSSRISEDGTRIRGMTNVDGPDVNRLQSVNQNGSKVKHSKTAAQSEFKVNHLHATAETGSRVNHFQSMIPGESKVNNLQPKGKSELKVNHLQPATPMESKVNHLPTTSPKESKVNQLESTSPRESKVNHLQSTRTTDSFEGHASTKGKNSTIQPSIFVDKRTGANDSMQVSIERSRGRRAPVQNERSRSKQEVIGKHLVGNGDSSLLEIDIVKRSIGICFCLEGGKDSPYGDGPIKVKRIFHGASDFSAGKERLQPGDELVSVNGKDLTTATHYTAWTFLRSLPEGIMQFVVRRKLSS